MLAQQELQHRVIEGVRSQKALDELVSLGGFVVEMAIGAPLTEPLSRETFKTVKFWPNLNQRSCLMSSLRLNRSLKQQSERCKCALKPQLSKLMATVNCL